MSSSSLLLDAMVTGAQNTRIYIVAAEGLLRTSRATQQIPSRGLDRLGAMSDLLILAHGGTWEMSFQVSSLAASVAAAGERVDVALFFAALDAWARGRW